MNYYTSQNCRELDILTQKKFGITAHTLMENAGRVCAEELIKFLRKDTQKYSVTVVSGPGNNGGDGLVIARHLATHKIPVRIIHCTSKMGDVSNFDSALGESPGYVVDALFGIGSHLPFDSFWTSVFELIMRRAQAVFSVDHPSGYATDDGQEVNAPHIKAKVTFSIGLPKFAHYTHAGPDACGRVVMCDAGFPPEAIEQIPVFARGVNRQIVSSWISKPKPHVHKNLLGHVGFLAGSSDMPGALSLCVQGALQSEAGKVTVFGYEEDFAVFQRMLPPEVMYSSIGSRGRPVSVNLGEVIQGKKISVLVVGPGLQMESKTLLILLKDGAQSKVRMVIDAEVFRLLSSQQLSSILQTSSEVAWLGHLGEQHMFFGYDSLEQMFNNSLSTYHDWIQKYPKHVWLRKGLGSISVSSQGRWLNESGNYGLAKGGSGDLLAGIIAALALRYSLQHAVPMGVWIHGACADRLTHKTKAPGSITPSQCLEELPHVFAEIYADHP